jgi:protein SCO1
MNNRRAMLTGVFAVGIGATAGILSASSLRRDATASANRQSNSTIARSGKSRSRANMIPNVEVVSHEGETFRFYDDLIKNRVVMINAFFAECGEVCPLVTQNLKRVYDMFDGRVGRDVHMISFTLQPERDTPELMKQFAEVYGVGPGWHLVTGRPADMLAIRKSLNFFDPDPELDVLADTHTGILRYGNDTLKRWAGCPALARPEGIYHSVTGSVMDAGIGRPAVPAADTSVDHHHHHHHTNI